MTDTKKAPWSPATHGWWLIQRGVKHIEKAVMPVAVDGTLKPAQGSAVICGHTYDPMVAAAWIGAGIQVPA